MVGPAIPSEAVSPNNDDEHITESDTNSPSPTNDFEDRYVELDPDYTLYHTWSNDPSDLDLYGVSSSDYPNLSTDFNVPGLKPIMKDSDGDMFLLTGTSGHFYLWDPRDGYLLKVADKWVVKEDMEKVKEKVDNVLRNLYWVIKGAMPVFKDRI